MPISSGTRLGPYEIQAPLGAGGMGEVYRASDTRVGRTVAIKVSSAQFGERFEREAHAIAQLNHAHICQLYDVGPNFLVMEYVEGTPLAGPLPVEKVIEYAGQILDAIDAAHRQGITHRDLKPGNILVTRSGIKLLDFGLAKKAGIVSNAGAATVSPLTGEGQIVGTLQYMSPEQLQAKEVDARSDLFSFGCVLYEMVTGRPAFDGENPATVIANILNREAPSLAGVAPALDRIVRRALAKDPELRFQTARDLKAALAWAVEHPPVVDTPRQSTRWVWVAAAAMLVLGVIAGWGASLLQPAPAPDDRVIRYHVQPPEGGRFVVGANLGGIALSPDGRSLAYVASVKGQTGLWIQPIDSPTPRPLAGTDGAGQPFWSPDSRSIAYVAGSTIYRIDVVGGAPLSICPSGIFRGGVWSPDRFIIFGSQTSELLKVPAAGGTPAPLTKLSPNQGFHGFPNLLADNHVLFWIRTDRAETTGAYVASLANPNDHVFLVATDAQPVYAPVEGTPGYLMWTRGETLLAQAFGPDMRTLVGEPRPITDQVGSIGLTGYVNATASRGGLLLSGSTNTLSRFVEMDRSGKVLRNIPEVGNYTTFRLAPDGRRIVAARERSGGSDLWILEIDRGVATRLTSRPSISAYPIWAPDGQSVVYSTDSPVSLFRRRLNDANDERLTKASGQHMALDWSQDGNWIILYESGLVTTGRDLSVLSLAQPGAKQQSYVQTAYSEWWARFAPGANPRWVAYQSDQSGRSEVYIDAFPTPRGAVQISAGGGFFPQWDPSARELFYVGPGAHLMSVALKIDGTSVVPSQPRELFRLPIVDTGRAPYDTIDGQRFIVRAVPQDAPQPLTMIVNWPALLKTP